MADGQFTYGVDLVLCIDGTGSMSPVIGRVREHAIRFYDDVTAELGTLAKSIDRLRIRVIVFRDYYCDAGDAMSASDFFDLPSQQEEFASFVSAISAHGGGDEPENGLEALALAIRSPWLTEGSKKRQVIVVWTDASTHSLSKNPEHPNYPSDLPKSLEELEALWDSQDHMDRSARRLILFAPDAKEWNTIGDAWEATVWIPSQAGGGMSETSYATVLRHIGGSFR